MTHTPVRTIHPLRVHYTVLNTYNKGVVNCWEITFLKNRRCMLPFREFILGSGVIQGKVTQVIIDCIFQIQLLRNACYGLLYTRDSHTRRTDICLYLFCFHVSFNPLFPCRSLTAKAGYRDLYIIVLHKT